MRKAAAATGSSIFFALAPGVVAGVVPWALTRWRFEPIWLPLRVVGGAVVVAGTVFLVQAFVRFVVEGLGTPAPIAPTEKLVVGGLYRYVRNPMYVAVVSVIFGQALLFGSLPVFWYGVISWLAMAAFVRLYEEPTLSRRYGEAYDGYRAQVPAWLPRRPRI